MMNKKAEINQALEQLLNEKLRDAQEINPDYAELLQATKTLLMRGGKRLRPILTLLAYEGCGGQDQAAIMPAAVSQELFHAFLLMHDDIIDRDQQRYDGPNVSGHFQEKFSKIMSAADPRHFADSWAMLAGDICYSLANESLLNAHFTPDLLQKAAKLLQATLFETVGGQIIDVAAIFKDKALDKQQLRNIAHYKTAIYSFQTPLQIGALLAGASNQQLAAIESFASHLGIAFQLKNDLDGMFSSDAVSDLREGKHTLLISYGLELASSSDQKIIQENLGNPKITKARARDISEILINSGAKAATEHEVSTELYKALGFLPKIGFTKAVTSQLEKLATDQL